MRSIPVRVVCHAILRTGVVPSHVQRLQRDVDGLCRKKGARLVEFVVDLGTARQSADEYRALDFVRNGRADVLLIIRAPMFDEAPTGDLLESLLLPDGRPLAWVTVPMLRRMRLLPPAVGLPTFAAQRAAVLRARGFTLDAVARWLNTEGYAAPSDAADEGWTRADVGKLLREWKRDGAGADAAGAGLVAV